MKKSKIEEIALIINTYVPDKSIAITDTLKMLIHCEIRLLERKK